MKQGHKCL